MKLSEQSFDFIQRLYGLYTIITKEGPDKDEKRIKELFIRKQLKAHIGLSKKDIIDHCVKLLPTIKAEYERRLNIH